jgi:indole-3-glycerol phosphate synthase
VTNILRKIVDHKRQEVAARRSDQPETVLESQVSGAPAIRNFRAALEAYGNIEIIAEVKKASPSAGVIREDFDPVAIATTYAEHGAACISVLTDSHFFQGELSYLAAIRNAVDKPLLRKDFIVDRYQLLEARASGADAVLLIAEVLADNVLKHLIAESRRLGMEPLVELYDAENLSRVLDSGARLIGINNRDLRSFETRLEHTLDLAAKVPGDCCLVSESGIRTRGDVLRLRDAGVRAVLVGETLMRAPDIGAMLDELRGCRQPSRP